MKIFIIFLLMLCYQITYADVKDKSIIITPIRYNCNFSSHSINEKVKKLKKPEMNLLPDTYVFKRLPLKMKFIVGYTLIDPNQQIKFENFKPFDYGIILLKLRFIIL